MGFVERTLHPGELVLVRARPHWRALVRPVLVTWAAAGLAGIAGGFVEVQVGDPAEQQLAWAVLALLAGLVVLRFAVAPAVRWARTDIVVTDERVLHRPAGSRRRLLDLPLDRVSAVRFRHTLGDRALGTGTLILECGHLPPVEIDDVPRVADVHALVYDELRRLSPVPLAPDPPRPGPFRRRETMGW